LVTLCNRNVGERRDPRSDARRIREIELLEGAPELFERLKASFRVSLEAARHHIRDIGRNARGSRRASRVQPPNRTFLHPLSRGLRVIAGEEAPVRERFPQQDADGEHVRARVCRSPSFRLFGGEVTDSLRVAAPRLTSGCCSARTDVQQMDAASQIHEHAVGMNGAESVRGLGRQPALVHRFELVDELAREAERQRGLHRRVLDGGGA
jgi:hypothetical protein